MKTKTKRNTVQSPTPKTATITPELPGEASKLPKYKLDVLIYDCFLLLDRTSRGFLTKVDIPSIPIGLKGDKIIFLKQLFLPHFKKQNDMEIITLEAFTMILKNNTTYHEIFTIRQRIYAREFRYILPFIRTFLLWIRYAQTESSLEGDDKPRKDYIMAGWNLFNTYKEAADHISDIVLLYLIYHYGQKPQNFTKNDYTIVIIVRLLAVASNYLISYSSGVQLLLHKGVFDAERWKNHNLIMKFILSLSFTFISPLYFVLLTALDMASTMLQMVAVIIVPQRCGFEKVMEFLEGLIRRMGLSKQEFEGLTEQKSMVQLTFQNVPVLIIDTLLLTRVVDCPELLEESLNSLLLSYGLTVFNLVSQIANLKMNADYLQEDFLSFCLISMKAKFGWIPYLEKLQDQTLTDNIVDYHQIQCPIPFITPLIGIYKKIPFEFSELTMRQFISTVGKIKTAGSRKEGLVQQIKIGGIVSDVPVQTLVQLLSAKPSYLILDMKGVDWDKCIELSKEKGIIPKQDGKWDAVTPLMENMLSFCVDSENEDDFEYFELMKALLEGGANPDTKDIYGNPVLIYAIQRSKTRSVKLLLEHGADPNILFDNDSSCALLMAFETDNLETAKSLIINKANIHTKIKYKGEEMTVLQKLVKNGEKLIGTAWSQYANVLSTFESCSCHAETDYERDTILFTMAKYANHVHDSETGLKIFESLKSILNKGDDYVNYKAKLGRNFLHYFVFHSHEDTTANVFKSLDDPRATFRKLQDEKDDNDERPVDYYLLHYVPKHDSNTNFIFNCFTLDWKNDTKLVENFKTWITNMIRSRGFRFLEQQKDHLYNNEEQNDVPEFNDILDQIFKKEKRLAIDDEGIQFFKDTFNYTIHKGHQSVKNPQAPQSKDLVKTEANPTTNINNVARSKNKVQTILQQYGIEAPKEEAKEVAKGPRVKLKRQATVHNKQKIGAKAIFIIMVLLEYASLFDLITDIIVLLELISAHQRAWTALTILTMITPYFISYAPLLTFLIEREVFKKLSTRKRSLLVELVGGLFLTPVCLIYFLALDLVYTCFEVFRSVWSMIVFVVRCGHSVEEDLERILDKLFEKAFKLNRMDVQGLRRLRTISQMIFESVPQIILQARILQVGASGLGVTPANIGISVGLAVIHLLLETLILYFESAASKADLFFYSVVCLNGRLNWVPFIEKLTRSRVEKEKLSFDGIEHHFHGITFKVEYEFSAITMDSLIGAVSMLPKLIDPDRQMTISLGKTCKNIDLKKIVFLIKLCHEKLQLDLEGLEWNKIIDNTYPGDLPAEPLGMDNENMLFSLVQANCADGLRTLLQRNCNANAINDQGKSLLLYAVERRFCESVEVLLDFGAEDRKIIDHENPCSLVVKTKDMNLIRSFLGHRKISISSYWRKKLYHLAVESTKDDPEDARFLINLLGGVNAQIGEENLEKLAQIQNHTDLVQVFEELRSNLPEFVYVKHESGSTKLRRDVLEKFKAIRINMLESIYMNMDKDKNKDELELESKNRPYDLSSSNIQDSEAFLLLYHIFATRDLPPSECLPEIDKAAKIVGLDETAFHDFYAITAPLRRVEQIKIQSTETDYIVTGEDNPTALDPPELVPWRDETDDFTRAYKMLQSFNLSRDVVAITNVRFVGSVEDQGFGGTNRCSLMIYTKTANAVFFDQLVWVKDHEGDPDYDLTFDGSDKCLDIQRMPVGGSTVEVWIQSPTYPGWSTSAGEFTITLTCVKQTEDEKEEAKPKTVPTLIVDP